MTSANNTEMMKKIVVMLIVCLGAGGFTYAQTDAKAKAILAQVSKKYKTYDVVKADFVLTMENQQATLYVKAKANKYKIAMSDQDLISDGKTQWTYLKENKEVQVTGVDNSSNALNPAKIFTIYEQGFKYLYTGESKVGGKVYQMIDLSPTDPKSSYFKIRLSIDKNAKQIANAIIFENGGNKYTYAIKSLVPNVKVAESTFSFDAKKYPGVEVVDLR
jgi:outer membrane lipoprotein-sorting protein